MSAPAFPDPRAEARTYLNDKGVLDLFQELGTLLMYHKPEDPRSFLVEQLQLLQEKQKTSKLGSSIFTESDIKTLFGMFDPTGKGSITGAQCKQALTDLAIKNIPSDTFLLGTNVSLTEFSAMVEKCRAK